MKKIFLGALILSAMLNACSKDEQLNVDLKERISDQYVPGEIDKWLTENFLNPYNMEVLYRFDRFQTKVDKDLIPVLESQVQPVMETVRDIWINPYLKVAGPTFLKPIMPKQVVMVGSAEYNTDGTITLGTADAGRRINLFVINDFNKENIPGVEQMLHTVHHEFAHILHQNTPVPGEYEVISPEYVGGSWISFSNDAAAAKRLGYITRYSRSDKNEDFAEVVSTLLVEGQEYFDSYANTASTIAKDKLKLKEQMVVDYYKGIYNIDFRTLQKEVRLAKEKLTGVVTPLGFRLSNGAFRTIGIDKNVKGQAKVFTDAYDSAIRGVVASQGYLMNDKFTLEFKSSDATGIDTKKMTLKIASKAPSVFQFWYDFDVTINSTTGLIKLTLSTTQGPGNASTIDYYENGAAFASSLKPLFDYLASQQFSVQWIESPDPASTTRIGGFFDPKTQALNFQAVLGN